MNAFGYARVGSPEQIENAVIYARYSSHSQGEQSIEGQIANARAYAAIRGYNVIHEYIDRAMSGRNDNRDDFQQMLSDCAKKQFTVIIVWKVDRFGRNREEITFNKYRAKKHGVRVEYVAENITPGPEGVILESVLEGMAEYYSLQLSQNIRRGNRMSAEKCQVVGGNRPLGYKTDPETKKFLIDPETAPTVKMVYDMYASGKTITEIINHLNALGLRTLHGRPFTHNSLRTVLKNEKYIGVYTYKDEIRVEGGVPAIIDKETFYKVQEMLKKNKRAPAHKWTRADYILTDKLFCGKCGNMMVGECGTSKTGARHDYYICTHKKRFHTCDKKAVRKAVIEGKVLDITRDILQDDATVDFIAESTWQYYLAQNDAQLELKQLQNQLRDVEKGISNLIRAIEAGIFNDATKARMDELEAQRNALRTSIAQIELKSATGLTKEYLVQFIKRFRDADWSDREVQQQVINVFVNSVFLYDDKVRLVFNYSGGEKTVALADVDAAADSGEVKGFVHHALCSTKTRTYELLWFRNVFAVTAEIPER